jgi:hypothetical protein
MVLINYPYNTISNKCYALVHIKIDPRLSVAPSIEDACREKNIPVSSFDFSNIDQS